MWKTLTFINTNVSWREKSLVGRTSDMSGLPPLARSPQYISRPMIAQIDYQSVTSFPNKLHEWLRLGKNRIQQNQLVSFSSFLISYFQAVLTINRAGGKIWKEKKRRKWPVALILTERIGGDYLDWFAGCHATNGFYLFIYFPQIWGRNSVTIIKWVHFVQMALIY